MTQLLSPIAQLVERAAVNRFVRGSSPRRGANPPGSGTRWQNSLHKTPWESTCGVLPFLALYKGFYAVFVPPAAISVSRPEILGCERNPRGSFRTPEFRGANSRILWLTSAIQLTTPVCFGPQNRQFSKRPGTATEKHPVKNRTTPLKRI